jgi:hypothetical protein
MKRIFRVFHNSRNKRLIIAVLLAAVLVPSLRVYADNVVQGYLSKGTVQQGFLVSMVKNSTDTVEATPSGDGSRIFGVVIDPSNAPLTLNRQTNGQVFVATTGNYPVFVTTERGNIRQGDFLSISSTSGIAALVGGNQTSIIGQALEAFDGKKGAITKNGNYSVGKIVVNIDPRKNPVATNDVFVPGFMRTVGQAVAGKPVSAQRIYLSLVFLIAAVTLATTLLWASVRGGMIAMGRNPLNRGHILNSMFKVVSAAVLVFLVGLFGVYLLLKV